MMTWRTRIALLLGLGASAGLWWLFWHISLHDRTVHAGNNWFENVFEPAFVLWIWTYIVLVAWESLKDLREREKREADGSQETPMWELSIILPAFWKSSWRVIRKKKGDASPSLKRGWRHKESLWPG